MQENKNNTEFEDIKDFKDIDDEYLTEIIKSNKELRFYINKGDSINNAIVKVKMLNFEQQKTFLCFWEKYQRTEDTFKLLFDDEVMYILTENVFLMSKDPNIPDKKFSKNDIQRFKKANDYATFLRRIFDYYTFFSIGLD